LSALLLGEVIDKDDLRWVAHHSFKYSGLLAHIYSVWVRGGGGGV